MSKTKLIDVYGITKVCRAVVDNEARFQMYERRGFLAEDGIPISLIGAIDQTIKVHDIPIHRIRTPEGDRFVAIEPGLERVLEAPFEARVQAAEERSRETRQLAERRIALESGFRYRLQAMPWWRRALFVLRRSNLETQP